MTNSSIRAILLVAVLVPAAPAVAQLDTSKPVAVTTLKPKIVKFRGEVLHMNAASITVRSRENERVIRSFTYSGKVRERMQRILDNGGYQFGDKVVIESEAGSNVALRIKGKPSKPL